MDEIPRDWSFASCCVLTKLSLSMCHRYWTLIEIRGFLKQVIPDPKRAVRILKRRRSIEHLMAFLYHFLLQFSTAKYPILGRCCLYLFETSVRWAVLVCSIFWKIKMNGADSLLWRAKMSREIKPTLPIPRLQKYLESYKIHRSKFFLPSVTISIHNLEESHLPCD